jgi:hypothetical protein
MSKILVTEFEQLISKKSSPLTFYWRSIGVHLALSHFTNYIELIGV